jgi:lysine-specific demethylase 8
LTHDDPDPTVQTDDLHPLLIERSQKNLAKAFAIEGACKVNLRAGESVLVPEGWWHSAEGGKDGPGVGVGAWFR